MRPDYSVLIAPEPNEAATFEPVTVHFDAKYRLAVVDEVFGANGEVVASTSEAKRTDLLKMHAYRDAIRRSVGAYVIFPGTDKRMFQEYQEILPGLGAFALRPTLHGAADGVGILRGFLAEVLDHVALQTSQHERSRYWLNKVYSSAVCEIGKAVPAARFLPAPPADTLVLLGYVRSEEHWKWIDANRLYNLRAHGRIGKVGLGSKQLACDLVILSSPSMNSTKVAKVTGGPEVRSQHDMYEAGYPNPKGNYYCIPIQLLDEPSWSALFDWSVMERIRSVKNHIAGAPIAISWLELIALVGASAQSSVFTSSQSSTAV
jgi:uncharacterized protein